MNVVVERLPAGRRRRLVPGQKPLAEALRLVEGDVGLSGDLGEDVVAHDAHDAHERLVLRVPPPLHLKIERPS